MPLAGLAVTPPRHRSAWVLAMLILGSVLPVLAACGSTSTQLSATVEAAETGTAIKPGDSPTYKITVTNNGPGVASGINVHADLPADFTYKSTVSITGDAARTQPVDPDAHANRPEWGVWSMAAPTVNDDGSRHTSTIVLTFIADAKGRPDNYTLQVRATGDNSEEDATAPPLAINLSSAPNISVSMSVSPGSVHPSAEVTYTVAVVNKGSAAANDVAILVTLPPVLSYSTTARIMGNYSRSKPIDPIKNTGVVFFSGFSIPPASDSNPGTLNISFRAHCEKTATYGSFPATAQYTDHTGQVIPVRDTAAVQVIP